MTPIYEATLKNLTLGFSPKFFWESPYMWDSQEIFLGPKVNVKFFTVDPIWQIWSLLGQKNMFFGGLVKRGNAMWIVFGLLRVFLGHQNDFWKFQKVS